MNKKILVSVFVVLLVIAASIGATMAWFTDQSDEIENVFTAGTVSINANEVWAYGEGLENWNPGDCTPKLIELEYTGSKKAFLRMQINEEWKDTEDGAADSTWTERDVPNVEWKINTGTEENPVWVDWNTDGKWSYHGGWWYYDGDDNTYTHEIDGKTFNAVSGDQDPIETITIVAQVCLDGPETGNVYQGATYTLDVVFQAIQASHEGEWTWDNVNFETGLVTP